MAVAQLAELRRQIPFLYILLTVNAVAVASTHYPYAPRAMTLWIPLALSLVCMVRCYAWLRPQKAEPSPLQAVASLRRTVWLAAAISIGFILWSLALDRYGGPLERGHVALFIAITVIGCIFCLAHLPQAALSVTALVTIPYIAYYSWNGEPVFVAVAFNIFLVTVVMIKVLLNIYGGFTELLRSKAALAAKQTETARLNEENARLAETDPLTGLPNRRFFFLKLQEELERAQPGQTHALALFDLDRFKPINDTYGHVLGDLLLEQVGERLSLAAGPDAIVARLGGDEFCCLLPLSGLEEATQRCRTICDALSRPYAFEDIQATIGCSCGIALFPDAGTDPRALFDRCDYALYQSKAERNSLVTVYSSAHEAQMRSDRAVEVALQAADWQREFEVHLQPILHAATGEVVAAEALARWNCPTLGRVGPQSFIPLAEKVGLTHRLTLTLLQKALTELDNLPDRLKLSFNLSAHDLTSAQTMLGIVAAVNAHGSAARRMIFEVTETAVMPNFAQASQSLTLLRNLGCEIALDDFGTGYSSLSYLHRLPIDKVKLDRSFVSEAGTPSGGNIVRAVVDLCDRLGFACVVEGIEDETQFELLKRMGCDYFQGYFFARPMPPASFLAWLQGSASAEFAAAPP